MQIQLNGDTCDIDEGCTIAALIDTLSLPTGRFAVEINEELIPRSEHAGYRLQQGDKVEVVQAIGGG